MSENVPIDLLGHTTVLDQRATFPLLGVPLELRSNSAALIAAADRVFGGWCDLDFDLIEAMPARLVSVIVQPVEGAAARLQEAPPFVQRTHSKRFLASDGLNLLTAQYDQGWALAFITPELLANEARLRYNVLEQLGLLLATQHDRVPMHAGVVVLNGLAIVLAGRSTAGKSTLSYACLRAGFRLLSEDVVYISRRRGLRLWGVPWHLHLLPDAVRFFPELADTRPEVQANGKRKLAIEATAFGAERAVRHAERAVVCVVERHGGAETLLEPVDPAIAVATLSGSPEAGFDLHSDTRAVAEALAAGGAYRLMVGYDLDRAAAALRGLASA